MINIGFDMDGVIVDFMKPVCEWLEIDETTLTEYRLEKLFPGEGQAILNYYGKAGYFTDLKCYPGAKEFLDKLAQRDNCTLWFISKPSVSKPVTYADKIKWVDEHFPSMSNRTLLGQDKSLVHVDILIEDDPDNLQTSIAEHKVLFDQPWNRTCNSYKRVQDYDTLAAHLDFLIEAIEKTKISQRIQYEYEFIQIDEVQEDNENETLVNKYEEPKEPIINVNLNKVRELGNLGYNLVFIELIAGLQHGWFKREKI